MVSAVLIGPIGASAAVPEVTGSRTTIVNGVTNPVPVVGVIDATVDGSVEVTNTADNPVPTTVENTVGVDVLSMPSNGLGSIAIGGEPGQFDTIGRGLGVFQFTYDVELLYINIAAQCTENEDTEFAHIDIYVTPSLFVLTPRDHLAHVSLKPGEVKNAFITLPVPLQLSGGLEQIFMRARTAHNGETIDGCTGSNTIYGWRYR
jgi:hypothetical protein